MPEVSVCAAVCFAKCCVVGSNVCHTEAAVVRFTIGGKHAQVRLNLQELHNLAARGGEYERQAQLALENIKLLPSADNQLLMIEILERITWRKAKYFRNRKELRGSQRSPSYREQKELWQAIHEDSYIQDEIEKVYSNVYDMLKFSNKLLKLLSPLARDDYLMHIKERVDEMRNIWRERSKLGSLFDIYAVESERINDGWSYPSEEDVENLVAKIMAEITAQDAAQAEKIQQQATAVASQFTQDASTELSAVAYLQAMLGRDAAR